MVDHNGPKYAREIVMAPLIRRLFVAAIATALWGCMNPALVQQQYQIELEAQQRRVLAELQTIKNNCDTKKRNEPGLHATLGSKMPLYGIPEMTVAMMASTEKPTEIERKMLLRSMEITMDCQKEALAFSRFHLPAPVVSVAEVSFNHGIGLGLELYHGRLTYGEYNRKMKETYTSYMQAIAQIEAEVMKQNAEATMRAQQLAAHQQQLFLNYLNSYNTYMLQQQQLQQQQRHGQITCSKIGQFTTCNY